MSISANHCGKYPSMGTGIYVKLAHPIDRYPGVEKEVGQVARVEYNLPRPGETTWTVEFGNSQNNDPSSPRRHLLLKMDSSCLDKYEDHLPICDCCQAERQRVCWEVACRYGWRASLLAKNAPQELLRQLGLEETAISAYKLGTNPELEESVLAKLRNENLSLDSDIEDIKAVLSKVVAPRKCLGVAIALVENHLRKKEPIHDS